MDRIAMLNRMSEVLDRVPRGKVLSYGRLAELAGFPGQSRLAAWLCRHLPCAGLPWHRVLSADGRSRIPDYKTREEQFKLLWVEDVPLRSAEQVDMTLALWRPELLDSDTQDAGI